MKAPLVMFIHGMYMTPHAWDYWQAQFRAWRLSTSAPPWPEHEGSVDALREYARNPALGAVTLDRVVGAYREIIASLEEKPVLIGHAMGGLVVQKLLSEGVAAAGIAINSVPPAGVPVLNWPFVRSNWPVFNPFARPGVPVMPTFVQFKDSFGNGLPPCRAHVLYERHIVPESRRVGRAVLSESGAVDFGARRGPLLMIAGGRDHVVPETVNRKNFECYERSQSVTDFELYEGRAHLTILEPGWKAVAARCLLWLGRRTGLSSLRKVR